MLRRAPTSISLSNRDVTEHLQHIEHQKLREQENKKQSKSGRRVVSAERSYALTDSLAEQLDHNAQNEVTVYEYGKLNQQRALRADASPFLAPINAAERSSPKEGPFNEPDRNHLASEERLFVDPRTDSEVEDNPEAIGSTGSSEHLDEPPVIRHESYLQESSHISRDTFDYGGFVEVNAEQLSSFTPQDASTPRNNEILEIHRLRPRVPLPRSPLFRAQGANSPERRLTTSLTPRVASYGAPGLLLSQPARRPRSYRTRTVSYSFEESDRASAVYEQVQGSDNDSIGSQPPSESQRSFHDDLEAGSWQTASLESNMPSSPPELAAISRARTGQATQAAEDDRLAHSSSPQLALPPPFSAVPRNMSLTASLPSAPRGGSQSRSPNGSSPRYDLPQLQASPATGSTTSSREEEDRSHGSSSILRNLAALPFRLLSVYRSRSPFPTRFDAPGSGRVSPTPKRSQGRSPEEAPATSTRRQFQIYDDSLPATAQPQTPQHLPEARHQSRFHPSYTAPASGRVDSSRPSRSEASQRRGTRSDSPVGMETPGFRGLYGGQENTDDEVMFDRASQRLWALSSARRHGRSMSNTPEREISFADNRGDYR